MQTPTVASSAFMQNIHLSGVKKTNVHPGGF
jgi:hypothetical protein